MERDFAGARLSEDDFERLVTRCGVDHKFPKTFADWRRLIADGDRQLAAEGMAASGFAIDPDAFLFWSQRVGIMPCLDSLRAFLIIHRGPAASTATAAQATPVAAPKPTDTGTASSKLLADLIAGLLLPPSPAFG